jgi:hypothetical protein
MANDKHPELLQQGVDAWNAWREKEPSVRPDLNDANLKGGEPQRRGPLAHEAHVSRNLGRLTNGNRPGNPTPLLVAVLAPGRERHVRALQCLTGAAGSTVAEHRSPHAARLGAQP